MTFEQTVFAQLQRLDVRSHGVLPFKLGEMAAASYHCGQSSRQPRRPFLQSWRIQCYLKALAAALFLGVAQKRDSTGNAAARGGFGAAGTVKWK